VASLYDTYVNTIAEMPAIAVICVGLFEDAATKKLITNR